MFPRTDPPVAFPSRADGTSNFLAGDVDERELATSGLSVCLVLVGAFDIPTGQPVFGAVVRPFHDKVEDMYVTH
jgi:hypothetical protein